MVKKLFFMKVTSVTLAAAMLCGCGGKTDSSVDTANSGETTEETEEVQETVKVSDTANADKAPDEGASGVADQAKDDTKSEDEPVSDDFNYESFYKPVLDEILNTMIAGVDSDHPTSYVPSGLEERIMYDPDNNVLQTVGYRIDDVSGDGFAELLIVDNGDDDDTSSNSLIYGIYTRKDGNINMTIDGWARSSHSWIGDNRFGYLGSGGTDATYFGIYHLSKDGTQSEWEDFYFTDGDSGDIKYYTNKEGAAEIDLSEETDPDTANKFWAYLDTQKAPQLEITLFDNYNNYDIDEEYIPSKISDQITYFTLSGDPSGELNADLDGNGDPKHIEVKCTQDDAYYFNTLTLSFDGKDYDLPKIDEAYAFIMDGFKCFWFRPGGDKQYLYAQYLTDSDYRAMVVYSFDGDKFELVDYLDGAILFTKYNDNGNPETIYPTDLDEFLVCKTDYILGTQGYAQKCKLGNKGLPEPLEEYRYYLGPKEPYIAATKDITCYYFENDDAAKGEPDTIKKGDMVTPYRSDGSTYLDLKVEGASGIYRIMIKEGETGRMELNSSEGTEDSLLLDDCFTGQVYAG
ncbi:MAG: hypothetical protein K6E70_00065 [Butyrivibrio sp.]|nr:hypothetical protein [Butyrivibrio sp.]